MDQSRLTQQREKGHDMPDHDEHHLHDDGSDSAGGGTATAPPPQRRRQAQPARPRLDHLPPWKVLLHNDDVNDMGYVVDTIMVLTPLGEQDAVLRMLEAHQSGVALLMATHQEHAELLLEQFTSRQLCVTIEPDAD